MQPNTSARIQPAGQLGCAAPRPQTQVECLLKELNSALDSLDKTVGIHAEKLGPVLRAECDNTSAEPAAPEELLVERADFIRRMLRRTRAIDSCICGLTERTEA